MPAFLYIDYGPSPYIARELRYSLATLLAEYDARPASVIVYTDKPRLYDRLHPRVSARDISADIAAMTCGGAYSHRIKPCVLLDALKTQSDLCVLLDTDSYILPGFADALARAAASGPAMDHFEAFDPYPDAKDFVADLPHAGRYRYDPAVSAMFNSGLVAAHPTRHVPAIEDAIALIDAFWDQGKRLFKIEQIAVSEGFRIHGERIGETRPLFQHYFRRSLKRYMHWRIDRWLKGDPDFKPARPLAAPSRNAVRVFNAINRVVGRY